MVETPFQFLFFVRERASLSVGAHAEPGLPAGWAPRSSLRRVARCSVCSSMRLVGHEESFDALRVRRHDDECHNAKGRRASAP